MKNRILYIALTAVITMAAFLIGRKTAQPEIITAENKVIPVNCIDISDIVDWNTNGEELSVYTNDGYEYYAYKSQNIYKAEGE